MTAKVVSVANRKGGVGKTTLTLSLAEGLAALKNKRVLVVDLDSQLNISVLMTGGTSSANVPWNMGLTIVDFIEKRSAEPTTRASFYISQNVLDHTPGKAVSLLSGDKRLLGLERRLLSKPAASLAKISNFLSDVIDTIVEEQTEFFDLIIFDCPPGFSIITDAALKRSDLILLPTAPTMLASQGIIGYIEYLTNDLQMSDASANTFVFLTMTGRTKTSKTFERLIRGEMNKPTPAYGVFDTGYSYCDGFQKATDRRDQVMMRTNAVWRRMDKLRGLAIFHRLYDGVTKTIEMAVNELMQKLEINGDENERSRSRHSDRSPLPRETRP
jgi:cellulose biosynthesis protein BcsQ